MRKLLACTAALLVTAVASTSHAGLLVSETFDTAGTAADYAGAGKVFSAFTQNTGGSGVVADGKLTLANDAWANISFGGVKSLVALKMDLTGVSYGAADRGFRLYAGDFSTAGSYAPGWTEWGSRYWSYVNVKGDAPRTVSVSGTGTAPFVVGETNTWSVFFNQSGSAQTFKGPDLADYTLNDSCWTFFIGSAAIASNVPKVTGEPPSLNLQNFMLQASRNWSGGSSETAIDNIVVRDDLDMYPVPEPASLGLLGVAGLILARRRS